MTTTKRERGAVTTTGRIASRRPRSAKRTADLQEKGAAVARIAVEVMDRGEAMDLQRISGSPVASPMMLRDGGGLSLPHTSGASCPLVLVVRLDRRATGGARHLLREGEKAESKLREGESIEMGDKKEGGERDALPAGV